MIDGDSHFNIFPGLESKNIEMYIDKDKIAWLENSEEIPNWLAEMFKSKDFKDKMLTLRKINIDSMNCIVENN